MSEITTDELVTLIAVLALAAGLLALTGPITRALEWLLERVDLYEPMTPTYDPYHPASHVKTLSACHVCGTATPPEELRDYTSTPLVDPEPTCPFCIEKAETEYEDMLRIASINNHRERI